MRPCGLLLALSFLFVLPARSQTWHVRGKVTNARMEPVALVSVEVKDSKIGTVTKEDGSYELELEEGHYELVFSMIGYKPQLLSLVIKSDYTQNVILELDETKNLSEVVIRGKARDRSEEYIRQVIRHKESLLAAAGAYSCNLYIKAVQEDSVRGRKKPNRPLDTLTVANDAAALNRMAMAEILLHLDVNAYGQIREERTGIKKRGPVESLFYLSATEGDVNFYHNLVRIPSVSQTPFLSPFSYSGLLAYRFHLIRTSTLNGHKLYLISVKPRQLSNATVEGEVTIADSSWTLVHCRLRFPAYHLPEYDFFEVEQQHELVNGKAWMPVQQTFTYFSKSNRSKKSGRTEVAYRDYELNKSFPPRYFGVEVSSTADSAYERDTGFWNRNRPLPLTEKELRFIRYRDSIYRATHTKAYLDSLDRVINRITWKKVLYQGQTFNNHEKERRWVLPPLPAIYQPFQFGGSRLQLNLYYTRTFPSRKTVSVFSDLSYGLRNHDVNGSFRLTRLYNPFNRGFFSVDLQRDFEYIYSGDAWINMLKRSNIYLDQSLGLGHGLELANGVFLYANADIAFRRSVSGYKVNHSIDSSTLGSLLDNNHAVAFEGYNALYGRLRLQYTPRQRYIREPREKVILGSSWPTFFVSLRQGIPGVLDSRVDFSYLEMGLEQEVHVGLLGISKYSLRTGSFLSRRDLRLVDYKWQRRGDPILFLNPHEAFQMLDSTFPVFHRFYQGHFVHEFNGALLNKIPLLKKLGLREMGGAGFLLAPERNLRYAELFTGLEKVIKWPFNPDTKFKLGVYVVGSAANQFRNPLQFKVGITSWDRKRGRWF